ncbi:MAG: thiamine-phosphate kinase [Rhodospirillales bacterium]
MATADPPSSAPLGEFGRIARLLRPRAAGFPGALDLTDDAAVFAPPPGRDLVVTTDAMVEGVHYLPDDPPGDVAAKLLRVNLSDLAAMGADPLAYTLTTALPRSVDDGWLAAFAAGLAADQVRFGIALMGGDSVSVPGVPVLSVTAVGTVPAGRAVRRGGARAGDAIAVTGTIGDAAFGLAVRLGRLVVPDDDARTLLERLRRPVPRTAFAAALREGATAAADVSDGLVADAGHLARASGLAIEIDAAAVPLSAAVRRLVAADPGRIVDAITGGDDYELVLAATPAAVPALAAAARAAGFGLTVIGRALEGPAGGVSVRDARGDPVPLAGTGWTHF